MPGPGRGRRDGRWGGSWARAWPTQQGRSSGIYGVGGRASAGNRLVRLSLEARFDSVAVHMEGRYVSVAEGGPIASLQWTYNGCPAIRPARPARMRFSQMQGKLSFLAGSSTLNLSPSPTDLPKSRL